MKPSQKAKLVEDLDRSGIPSKYIKKLGLEVLQGRACKRVLGSGRKVNPSVLAYKIPFFNHKGVPIAFSRLRLLEGTWDTGFKKKKDGMPRGYKYNQKAGTAPRLYFPNLIKWPRKKGKVRVKRLVITEGEKKAIKAALVGLHCVALAGVWNFKSQKKQISLIEDFKIFDLSNTDVEICYDSDLSSNENVRLAINSLAAELVRLRPKSVSFVMLDGDSSGEGKIGLDDYLAGFDSDGAALRAYGTLPRKVDARMDSLSLFDRTICLVKEHTLYFNVEQNKYYRGRQQLQDEFDRLPKVNDPEDVRRQVSAIKLWFDLRSETTDIHRVVYAPGQPSRYRENGQICDTLNTWRPTSIQPVKGKPSLWLELFEHLTTSLTDEERRWFMQWLAYPIQNQGAKLFTSVFVWSKSQGVGKNFLVEPFLKQIYGSNFSLINGSLMATNYNSWAAEKQFVFMDEIYMPARTERKSVMSDINFLITNPTFEMNEKYQPRRTLQNTVNLYMTSNYQDALMISPEDRRFLIVHAPEEHLERDFYDALDKAATDGDEIGKVLHWLQNEVDCSDFNPKAEAPKTEARREVVAFSADNTTHLIDTLIRDPGSVFHVDGKLPDKQLWTANELNGALNKYASQIGMSGVACSPQGLGSYLHHRLIEGKRRVVKLRVDGKPATLYLYAIFNADEWAKRSKADWLLHYKKHDARFRDELKNVVELPVKRKRKEK